MQRKEKDNRPLRRLVVYSLKGADIFRPFFCHFLWVEFLMGRDLSLQNLSDTREYGRIHLLSKLFPHP